jgi:hypothetical protein
MYPFLETHCRLAAGYNLTIETEAATTMSQQLTDECQEKLTTRLRSWWICAELTFHEFRSVPRSETNLWIAIKFHRNSATNKKYREKSIYYSCTLKCVPLFLSKVCCNNPLAYIPIPEPYLENHTNENNNNNDTHKSHKNKNIPIRHTPR